MKDFLKRLLFAWISKELEKDEKPEPPDPPAPEPVPPSDEFPAGIRWLGQDVSQWPVTATLRASVGDTRVNLSNDADWPTMRTTASDGGPLMGNAWVLAEVGGQWYAATWEWMRQRQQFKAKRALHGDHIKRKEFGPDWQPKSGQRIGLMISTGARNAERTSNERSNISWVVWP